MHVANQTSQYFMRIPSSQAAATNRTLFFGQGVLRDAAASKAVCVHEDKIITITVTFTIQLLLELHLLHWHGCNVTKRRSFNPLTPNDL
jgi:hypothetical protein